MRGILRLVLVASPLVAGCDSLSPPPVGSIVGRVVIEGKGARDVTVALSGGSSTFTDPGGHFRFDEVEGGSYTVTITGFPLDVTFPFTSGSAEIVSDGETVVVDFRGQYIRTASLVGRVTADGNPVVGVSVELSGMSENLTSTDDAGQFTFANLRAGDYTISISGYGDIEFPVVIQDVSVAVGESRELTFAGFSFSATIAGRVSVEGAGLPSIVVSLSGRQDEQMATDANGRYSFTRLPAGDYTVVISRFNPTDVAFSTVSSTISLAAGEVTAVDFAGTYVRESAIVGQVSVGGNGLAGVTVSLQGMGIDRATVTDAAGQYAFTGLRAGEYQVAISGYDTDEYGFATTSATVRVEHGRTANVPFEGIRLRTGTIVGRVSVEGQGIADVTVSLSGEGESQTTMTDESGKYSFTELPAGNFQVGISGYDTDDYSFETTSKNVALPLGETVNVPFEGIRLRTAAIFGQVSVEGEGLKDVTVHLTGGGESQTTTTNNSGQFAFTELPVGNFQVAISGYDTKKYSFETTKPNFQRNPGFLTG